MLEFLLNEYKNNVLTFLLQINGMKGAKFGMKGREDEVLEVSEV
jgi:hypothetical protein